MYCPNCGKELLEGAKFCPDCGEKIGTEKSETVNTVAEEVEIVEKETVDTFARIEEQSAAPMQEKNEPAQPTPVNTVPPVATNPAPANASFEISPNGKITSGKKGRTKFKDLSPKQKAIRFGIGGLLLLIGIIWIVSDGVKGSEKAGNVISGIVVENEAVDITGGVCFNITIDKFIDNYNNNLAYFVRSNETYQSAGQDFIDDTINVNSIALSDFDVYSEKLNDGNTYTVYKLNFNKIGLGFAKEGQSAGLYVYTDPNTKQIFCLDYLVSDGLINSNSNAKEHWLNEISVCIFADFTDYTWSEEFYYSNNILHVELYDTVGKFDHLIIGSCTKDSYFYEQYNNM